MSEEIIEPRVLFNNKEKVEILTLAELKKTNIAWADLQRSKTTPVAHYELIEDLLRILSEAGQEPILEHIYATNQAGSTALRNLEENYGGVKNILQAWLLRKVTGKIYIPRFDNPDLRCCIAFAYHDKGIDVAFGQDVRDCTNMCIYGSHILHTWGKGQNVDYQKMLDIIRKWAGDFDAMADEDRLIIRRMQETIISTERQQRFMGKMLLLANAANMNRDVVAPLNVTQCNEVCRGLLSQEDSDILTEGEERSLWIFYNEITFVMKAGQSDITSLLTDVSELGNIMVKEFDLLNADFESMIETVSTLKTKEEVKDYFENEPIDEKKEEVSESIMSSNEFQLLNKERNELLEEKKMIDHDISTTEGELLERKNSPEMSNQADIDSLNDEIGRYKSRLKVVEKRISEIENQLPF